MLFLDTEESCDMLFERVAELQLTTWRFIPENRTVDIKFHFLSLYLAIFRLQISLA